LKNYPSFWRNLENIPQINEENLKDVNMPPLGLVNTKISTNYVQNSPQTLDELVEFDNRFKIKTLGYSSHPPV
jgi:hypothetical protein